MTLFTLSSAACALAPNTAELTVARTVQGLGAAAVLPLSLTILTTAYPPHRRGLIVGIYGGLAGLAVAAGPVIGGVVTEGLDWHWIFWLNVPIGLLATRLLPEATAPQSDSTFAASPSSPQASSAWSGPWCERTTSVGQARRS